MLTEIFLNPYIIAKLEFRQQEHKTKKMLSTLKMTEKEYSCVS